MGQQAFDNFRVVPPGTGIVHQVNLEYLATVVTELESADDDFPIVYSDTVVGTDSHTTMINGLSVLGWGVGGIEAEAALLGQPLTMLIPDVVGLRFIGELKPGVTATDLVLKVVQVLRTLGVVGKFVEFFGAGLQNLSLADRATISNMAPEYGATCGFFPIDEELLKYLMLTGRDEEKVKLVEAYAKAQGLWRDDNNPAEYSHVVELDLEDIEPAVAGPNRPQDLVLLNKAPESFQKSLIETYKVKNPNAKSLINGMNHELSHGDVVIAAITSCTNTSNPEILLAAGLIAKKAVERGLCSKPWVKTSFAPGSKVVTSYLEQAGLMKYLEILGFFLSAYGCTTCIGNSGPLPEAVAEAVVAEDLVTVNVLSGNRNFEGRINPISRASYLASPPLVVLYALTGTFKTNLTFEPIGTDSDGESVFLKDLWPDDSEVKEAVRACLKPELFKLRYNEVFKGPEEWRNLSVAEGKIFAWEDGSTYIRKPPFFDSFNEDLTERKKSDIENARCLAILPDSTTTDHISPAGNIPAESPAGRYLQSMGCDTADFNSYGSRRANHEVLVRGTFANIRIKNRMTSGIEGGYTIDKNSNVVPIFDAAMSWNGTPLIVFAGKEYGTGSSRDWAAKGPLLQGVKAVIAESYERIHRSNLIGMGILPLEFTNEESANFLNIKGNETFTISGLKTIKPFGELAMKITKIDGGIAEIRLKVRIDTELELKYWQSGGILNYVLSGFLRPHR